MTTSAQAGPVGALAGERAAQVHTAQRASAEAGPFGQAESCCPSVSKDASQLRHASQSIGIVGHAAVRGLVKIKNIR